MGAVRAAAQPPGEPHQQLCLEVQRVAAVVAWRGPEQAPQHGGMGERDPPGTGVDTADVAPSAQGQKWPEVVAVVELRPQQQLSWRQEDELEPQTLFACTQTVPLVCPSAVVTLSCEVPWPEFTVQPAGTVQV